MEKVKDVSDLVKEGLSREQIEEVFREYEKEQEAKRKSPTPLERLRKHFDTINRGAACVPLPGCLEKVSDKLGGGLWEGVHVLVGSTGTGKSQLCVQIADEAIRADHPVLYITLELRDYQLLARMACYRIGYHWSDLLTGRSSGFCDSKSLQEEAIKAAAEIEGLTISQQSAYSFDADQLADTIEEWALERQKSRKPLIIIDYLQLLADQGGEEARIRIQQAAYIAREAAAAHKVAVILVSSTARQYYAQLHTDPDSKKVQPLGKGDPGRLIGLGKESGEIEYAAESVIVIGKEQWPSDIPPEGGSVSWIALAKNRLGSGVWQRCCFDGLSFSTWEADQPANTDHWEADHG